MAPLLTAIVPLAFTTILTTRTTAMPTASKSVEYYSKASRPRIAIIGGGAAGLACARVFTRNDSSSSSWNITVLEKDQGIGGVWNYRESDTKTRPMYRGLRTNLPKEIMAFREFPWPPSEDNDNSSFVTHRQVQHYLEKYAKKYDIRVRHSCEVMHLSLLDEDRFPSNLSPSSHEIWPKVELTIREISNTSSNSNNTPYITESKESFDAVLVANGHFNVPRIPHIPGLEEHFANKQQSKRMFHSIEYDNPVEFRDQTVLCMGGRSSGADIAREIVGAGAKHVYLSDSSRTSGEPRMLDRLTWVPRTIRVLPGGVIEFDHDCPIQAHDVDVIIFCTGYDYSFPFITDQSRLELDYKNQCVTPLYEQLWHARYPHVAFVGLPHSIVPFPLFEFQAEACHGVWKKKTLPSMSERLREAVNSVGGEGKQGGRIEDTHYLGDAQWDYCTRMAQYAELYDENTESYLKVNKVVELVDQITAVRGLVMK